VSHLPYEAADRPANGRARLLRWFFVALFWAASIFALVMAIIPQPPPIPGEPSDKVLHVLAFATLTFLWVLAYPRTSLIVIFVGLAVFGGLIELLQGTETIQREASLADWWADILAVLAVLTGAALVRGIYGRLRG
jgi:hypothetical protein